MFCRTNQWEGSKFPRELFHDSNSAGGRVLMHTKVDSGVNTSADSKLALDSSDDYRDVPS